MKAITIYIALFLIIIFSACEKVQKVEDFPRHQGKLVVNSLFEVDSVWRLTFSKSLSPLDNARFRILENPAAYAVIYEDGRMLDTLILKTNPSRYEAKYIAKLGTSPQPGHQYEIKTYYPGEAETTAREYLPEKASVSDLKIYTKSFQETDYGNGYKYVSLVKNVSFTLNDNISNNDFYKITVIQLYKRDSFSFSSGNIAVKADNRDNTVEIIDWSIFVTENYSSKKLDRISLDIYSYSTQQDTVTVKSKLVLLVQRMGENGFKYDLAASKQRQNRNDPFAQPAPIWNNINGGYGIFGGFSVTEFEFDF